MPKNSKTVMIGEQRKTIKITSKLRIGDRKTGRSAFEMSNAQLMDVLTNPDRKRYCGKAEKVLRQRGVEI